MDKKFELSQEFLAPYKDIDPEFGFNGVGELAYRRTYSRVKADGTKEEWWETIARVVNWVYQTQQEHIMSYQLGWDNSIAKNSAEEMFDRMFKMKFLPPGRGLWVAGTELVTTGNGAAALNNCGFVTTENIAKEGAKPFEFMMDMSMLGVGIGFDVLGAHTLKVQDPIITPGSVFVVPDSREGWVAALRLLLNGYLLGDAMPAEYDFSEVRAKGEPIKGFGGVASGPGPLKELLETLDEMLSNKTGEYITSTIITDIMNLIGACVVAGNVRRTAQLAIGHGDDKSFMELKDYRWDDDAQKSVGPAAHRAAYGWTSNNSVAAVLGQDYQNIAKQIAVNGEPGVLWLENMQAYSRMCDAPDYKDHKAKGSNPCVEQTLEPYELCCLVETFPTRNNDLADYLRTLKFAYLYAKTVTMCSTHWPETNRVLKRNSRIGTSMSGIAQFLDTNGIGELRQLCDAGYAEIQYWDEIYSDWLCMPRSLKTTSVKPSGTVSLLAGCTPGIHWPESTTYIRRMRIAKDSDLIPSLFQAGYPLLDDPSDKTAMVVEIPVEIEGVRKLKDVSMWEQLNLAAFMQEHWADNQVSATITFDPETEGHQIEHALNFFQYKLKGISFLPRVGKGVYPLMPYEECTKEEFESRNEAIKAITWGKTGEAASGEKFCSNDSCTI